ncbi:MAG: RDD family protein, partial [Acidobacteria bacterium]|nr:RDD family protein [Acidobacteriota bacterium]
PVAVLPVRRIGSIWRRMVAFVVDSFVIGAVASLIAFPLFDVFSRLGAWGRLAGFAMALPYFAILSSEFGDGQTLGKHWLGLQVVDRDGLTISFPKSVIRYAVLWIPFFVNQLPLPVSRTSPTVTLILLLLIFGLGGANVYLVVFNRNTRQGLHDLAAGSYVVEAKVAGQVSVPPIWKTHWTILGVSFSILFIVNVILVESVAHMGPLPQLLADARLVESMNGVQSAGIQDLHQRQLGVAGDRRILVINILWMGKEEDESKFADSVAYAILENDPGAKDHDAMQIAIIHGFDLGIAHGNVTHRYVHSIDDWKARFGL